jgi:hypothetical protein
MVLFPIALLRVAIVLVYAIRRGGQEPIDPPEPGPGPPLRPPRQPADRPRKPALRRSHRSPPLERYERVSRSSAGSAIAPSPCRSTGALVGSRAARPSLSRVRPPRQVERLRCCQRWRDREAGATTTRPHALSAFSL